jgi:murein DD-endopeptidase MepM/ murein hydrolase activator NlpD
MRNRIRAVVGLPVTALAFGLGSCAPAVTAHAADSPTGRLLPPVGSDDVNPFRDELGLSFPGIRLRADPGDPADTADTAEAADTIRLMRFPVTGDVTYEDTFGACRGVDCSRQHMGIDIFAPKLRPLVAAQTGRVTWLRTNASGTAGNGVGITDAEGWRYLYLHVNNDTPGTDDSANPAEWRFASGVTMGSMVEAGDVIGFLGDSGNAETTPPHVHFELRTPAGETVNPYPSLRVAQGPAAALG